MHSKESIYRVAICQPHYLPWIGYFEMIDRVDTFVFLDDVQFIKREWKNRNQIRKTNVSEETKWLTVPIRKQAQETSLLETLISEHDDWKIRHLDSMKDVYRFTPFFDEYFPLVESVILNESTGKLVDLNIELVQSVCRYLNIDTPCVRSSTLKVDGKREEKLRNICEALGASVYLANNATGNYTGEDYFREKSIEFQLQNYQHPEYVQRGKKDNLVFKSHLSIVDLLFNHGRQSLDIIRSGRPVSHEPNAVEAATAS